MPEPIEQLILIHQPRTASIETCHQRLSEPFTQEHLIGLALQAEKLHPIGYAVFEWQYLGGSKTGYQRLMNVVHHMFQQGRSLCEITQSLELALHQFETDFSALALKHSIKNQ
ncbi:hypothetical protein [Vibrio astriarenae]|uniref:hypothetical protein n=1 Tax=Vibrio astriarenae TaxID=1481923 RepID=UPI003736457E